MSYIHGSDIVENWRKLSLLEQMGNIGSEVSRARKWHDRDGKIFMNCVWRALELFDLTISDSRWVESKKEICRAKEVFCDLIFGSNEYQTTLIAMDRYFTQFGTAARLIKV